MSDYLGHIRMSVEDYKEQAVRPEALRRTQAELILGRVAELRPLEVADADVQEEVEQILRGYENQTIVESLRKRLVAGEETFEDMRRRMQYRKIIDRFFGA